MITCCLRYEIDPAKSADFEAYARLWIPLAERFGGTQHDCFLPKESASDLAVALFSFPGLADCERYRAESADGPDCRAANAHAERTRCIRRYDRQFLRPVLGVETDETLVQAR